MSQPRHQEGEAGVRDKDKEIPDGAIRCRHLYHSEHDAAQQQQGQQGQQGQDGGWVRALCVATFDVGTGHTLEQVHLFGWFARLCVCVSCFVVLRLPGTSLQPACFLFILLFAAD